MGILDKNHCDYIVHWFGACTIQNHVMMVTEYAPCGSLVDCIKHVPEPNDQITTKANA